MSLIRILTVCFLSFIVSIFSISVGGTSLITVPVLISLGMISKNAVATNMFALIFLSISGAVGLRREIVINRYKMIAFFYILMICGSFLGANLVLTIERDILKKVIAIMACIIASSFLLKRDLGIQKRKEKITKMRFVSGAILIFILWIYGGFFSGGYVTLLSYVFILILGWNFLQTAFITKIFNIFSSTVACGFFYYQGLIDFSVGIPLALSMFLCAFLGSKLALAKGNLWIRNLFIIAVIFLAMKLLLFR